ncbi:MAG: hypothetical protein AAF909_03340 [Pseudomonadota bacterium]
MSEIGAVLEVMDPGLATSVQDLGRPGRLRIGVPQGGALDRTALRLATAITGGAAAKAAALSAAPPGPAALEIRYLGPRLRVVEGALTAALAGADALLHVDRAETALGRQGDSAEATPLTGLRVHPGDVLRVGALRGSATAILALGGGVLTPLTLGARATFARGGFGGVEGRLLQAGDRLEIAVGASSAQRIAAGAGPPRAMPDAKGVWTLRLVDGPQAALFDASERARLCATVWAVTRQADRMGLRLEPAADGAPPAPLSPLDPTDVDIVSDGAPEGAVQIPGDGRPILLLADRGATGGYPKPAVVASVDIPLLARLQPGDRLRFHHVSLDAARAALFAAERALRGALGHIEPAGEPGVIDVEKLWSANLITAHAAADTDLHREDADQKPPETSEG